MRNYWIISETDIKRVSDFVTGHSGTHVEERIARNVHRKDLLFDRDTMVNVLLYCLLQPVIFNGRYSHLTADAGSGLFTIRYDRLFQVRDIRLYIHTTLKEHGIIVDIKRAPEYFAINLDILESAGWGLLDHFVQELIHNDNKEVEKRIADQIDSMFKGFGAVEARIFLQMIGLTKYEIPIDPVVAEWMNGFGFPVMLSSTALQDRNIYHFVSHGVQMLCRKADIYPCVLEAAIHSEPMN